jgi:hypothetical protein
MLQRIRDLLIRDSEPLAHAAADVVGQDVQDCVRGREHPGGHDVRVRLVVQAGPVGTGVAVVVLVGAHHAPISYRSSVGLYVVALAQKRAMSLPLSQAGPGP